MQDSSYFIHDLDPRELLDRDRLVADNGQSHYRVFMSENKISLSGLFLEGSYFYPIFILNMFVLIPILFLVLFQLLRPWIRILIWGRHLPRG